MVDEHQATLGELVAEVAEGLGGVAGSCHDPADRARDCPGR